jgi:hypothetical protein
MQLFAHDVSDGKWWGAKRCGAAQSGKVIQPWSDESTRLEKRAEFQGKRQKSSRLDDGLGELDGYIRNDAIWSLRGSGHGWACASLSLEAKPEGCRGRRRGSEAHHANGYRTSRHGGTTAIQRRLNTSRLVCVHSLCSESRYMSVWAVWFACQLSTQPGLTPAPACRSSCSCRRTYTSMNDRASCSWHTPRLFHALISYVARCITGRWPPGSQKVTH